MRDSPWLCTRAHDKDGCCDWRCLTQALSPVDSELMSDAQALANELAMHVAGMRPSFVSPERAGAADVAEERARVAARVDADDSMRGKPQSVIDKILEGRLRKSLAEMCLSEQRLVTHPDLSVRDAMRNRAGGRFDVAAFMRIEVGEGVERAEVDVAKDFAAEVHAQVAKSRS